MFQVHFPRLYPVSPWKISCFFVVGISHPFFAKPPSLNRRQQVKSLKVIVSGPSSRSPRQSLESDSGVFGELGARWKAAGMFFFKKNPHYGSMYGRYIEHLHFILLILDGKWTGKYTIHGSSIGKYTIFQKNPFTLPPRIKVQWFHWVYLQY